LHRRLDFVSKLIDSETIGFTGQHGRFINTNIDFSANHLLNNGEKAMADGFALTGICAPHHIIEIKRIIHPASLVNISLYSMFQIRNTGRARKTGAGSRSPGIGAPGSTGCLTYSTSA
jgi:hypothetical protein